MKKYIAGLLFIIFICTCSNSTDPNPNAPTDHTINIDGALHKSGLNNPAENCTSCHGADLKGSDSAPSCFKCHGEKW
jgi:hypothetical protein